MISLPRPLLVGLAATFSGYHVVLGLSTLPMFAAPLAAAAPLGDGSAPGTYTARVVAALAMYAVATALSLVLGRRVTMPTWLAALNVGVALAITLLVTSAVEPRRPDLGYVTWYVAAAGTLLTITAVRRHGLLAWFGVAMLAAQTVVWAGPGGIFRFGVVGDIVWIAVAHVFIKALARAALDVRQFARAEREALEWQAAQDAHHTERQVRVAATSRTALPMLERIVALQGGLDAAGQHECRVLEQSIRDEIRGRRLLNDAVRREVMVQRRRGAFVQVLDDGGVDDLTPVELDPVLDRVATALAGLESERIIIRTAPRGSARAVTVVGLSVNEEAAALGIDGDDDVVDLWLELDRPSAAASRA